MTAPTAHPLPDDVRAALRRAGEPPPARLLMGPGPITVDPRVQQAMSNQLLGQFDPWMTGAMSDVMALYRGVFQTANEATLLVDGTARAGTEAALTSLVRPGERVLVPVFGRFGHLLREIAERAGAEVHVVEVPWGEVFTLEALEAAVARVRPALVAMVQGDTSTTMLQPLEGVGAACHRHGALLYVDCTASLGGNPLPVDAWEVDVASAGLQKCLGGPSGTAPISLSPRAVAVVDARRSVEAGLVPAQDRASRVAPVARRIRSNYFDLGMVLDYWGEERLNHHTESATLLYAARECARLLLEEGVDAAVERHRLHGAAMLAGVRGLGLAVYGDARHKMHNIVAVHVPDGVGDAAVRSAMLHDYGIEIGAAFGPLTGRVWRIGTMGHNARRDAVLVTLAALEQVLHAQGLPVDHGAAAAAAAAVYAS